MSGFSVKGATPGPIYRCRNSILGSEVVWRLTDDALERDDAPYKRIPYADIRRIGLFGSPGLIMQGNTIALPSGICRVKAGHGRRADLCSNHFLGLGRFEDRSATFEPFVAELVRRAVAANPAIEVHVGLPAGVWVLWVLILIVLMLVCVAAFGAFIFATVSMLAALWSRDVSAITWEKALEAALMLLAAFSSGVGIPGIVSLLRRERPRMDNRGRSGPAQ